MLKQDERQTVMQRVVTAVEKLRAGRQAAWSNGRHPQDKRFSQEELTAVAYRGYKNMLLGRTRRLPSREGMMAIADYLECTLSEHNQLLLAAEYTPVPADPTGDVLTDVLVHAGQLVDMLPFPAMIVTRNWQVHGVNRPFLTIFGLPDWEDIPAAGRHLFHFTFDTTLPCRERATVDLVAWRENSTRALSTFKSHNALYQHEAWYRQIPARFGDLPDFLLLWDMAESLPLAETYVPTVKTMAAGPERTLVHYSQLFISLGATMYPGVLGMTPIDEAAHAFYARSFGYDPEYQPWRQLLKI